MKVSTQDSKRDVIPRWRSFDKTVELKEVVNIASLAPPRSVNTQIFQTRMQEWERNKTVPFAGDLLSTAFVLGKGNEVKDVAQFVVDSDAPHSGKSLALRILGVDLPKVTFGVDDDKLRAWIRFTRDRIRLYPRDAFSWVDLALGYSSLGQKEKASKAIWSALQLAPDDRFVLRAAARFFTHIDDCRTAHNILKGSQRTKQDPWLIAAEIATARACDRSPKFFKFGCEMIKSRSFQPYDLSELATSVGMVELSNNRIKRVKDYLKVALINPTENTIAQAHWAVRHEDKLRLDEHNLNPALSFEAGALLNFREGDWNSAIAHAEKWRADQPFSNRPAILATYIANGPLDDAKRGCDIAKESLKANPDNPYILNNIAIAFARQGNVKEAQKYYNRIKIDPDDEKRQIIHTATQGLILYRSGQHEAGFRKYAKAILLAQRIGNHELIARARITELRERFETGYPVTIEEINSIKPDVDKADLIDVDTIYDNLLKAQSKE